MTRPDVEQPLGLHHPVDQVLACALRRYHELQPQLWRAVLLSEFGRHDELSTAAASLLALSQRRLLRAISLEDPRAEAPPLAELVDYAVEELLEAEAQSQPARAALAGAA